MHQQSGDIHHIVPKDYLQKNGYPGPRRLQPGRELRAHRDLDQHQHQQQAADARTWPRSPPRSSPAQLTLGEITDPDDLAANLAENAVPAKLAEVTAGSYKEFLVERRKLMAATIRDYYQAL